MDMYSSAHYKPQHDIHMTDQLHAPMRVHMTKLQFIKEDKQRFKPIPSVTQKLFISQLFVSSRLTTLYQMHTQDGKKIWMWKAALA
jgi:hypothetical protein